jgi:DNA-binding MarR family transcriptional regulator
MTADGPRALSDFIVPTCLDMLNEIARLHGLGHLANAPEADRIRLISEALAHERTLFVLDNLETLSAVDAERLFTFINRLPESCKAIVTSRPRPGDEGCIIDLRKLHKTAAMKYLAELATDRPILKKSNVSQREKLYEETGGNPLLMRWVVGQLGRGNCQTLAKAIKFLREAPDDNDPLKFIFEDMAGDLSKSEIKAIHGLSGTPGPLDVRALAKQAKLTVNAATTVLSDLTDRGLVNADPLRETFSVLPIVVSYLKKSKRTHISSSKAQE